MIKCVILLPFLISCGCAITYNIIGSRVLSDGTLDEPFFLVPIECFFFLVGILLLLIQLILFVIKRLF